jgi:hypothetical protein
MCKFANLRLALHALTVALLVSVLVVGVRLAVTVDALAGVTHDGPEVTMVGCTAGNV